MNNECARIIRYLASAAVVCFMCVSDNFDILLFEIEMEVGMMDGTPDVSWHRNPLHTCVCVCV